MLILESDIESLDYKIKYQHYLNRRKVIEPNLPQGTDGHCDRRSILNPINQHDNGCKPICHQPLLIDDIKTSCDDSHPKDIVLGE